MAFRRAERKRAKLRLAIMGPSGSGKTYSALMVAKGIGGSVALIDTEQGSGELYAHLYEYDVAPISAPFEPQKYIDLLHEAERAGYETIIIDSLSHAWAGEGGMLDIHDKATQASRAKNSYTAWRQVTPLHNKLIDAILQSPAHVIVTARTKVAYEIQESDRGKKAPVKVGLAPVFREGLDYEMTVCFDLSLEGHIATVSKDRTSLFDGKYVTPSEDTGRLLLNWLESGVDPAEADYAAAISAIEACQTQGALHQLWSERGKEWQRNPRFTEISNAVQQRTKDVTPPAKPRIEESQSQQPEPLTPAQLKAIQAHYSGRGHSRDQRLDNISKFFGRTIGSVKDLTKDEATELIDALNSQEAAA